MRRISPVPADCSGNGSASLCHSVIELSLSRPEGPARDQPSERIDIHPADYALAQQAARLQHMSLTDFIRLAIYSHARQTIDCHAEESRARVASAQKSPAARPLTTAPT